MEQTGKHAGARRAPAPERDSGPPLLVLALGITVAVVAWGYLVYLAIDFGSTARGGESVAWAYLGVASLGAVASLFVAMMLVARVMRKLGISRVPQPDEPAGPVGGRRIAR